MNLVGAWEKAQVAVGNPLEAVSSREQHVCMWPDARHGRWCGRGTERLHWAETEEKPAEIKQGASGPHGIAPVGAVSRLARATENFCDLVTGAMEVRPLRSALG